MRKIEEICCFHSGADHQITGQLGINTLIDNPMLGFFDYEMIWYFKSHADVIQAELILRTRRTFDLPLVLSLPKDQDDGMPI